MSSQQPSLIRKLGKQVLAPIARPILVRLDRRMDRRYDPRLQALRHDAEAQAKQLRLLQDSVSAQATFLDEARAALENDVRMDRSRLQDELGAIRDRLEFARNELMYEIRYGGREPGGAEAEVTEPRIVKPDRLAERGDDVQLNLGCGHIPLPGFLNVDSRELGGVDIVADVHRLPFDPGTLTRIHSAHLLEHFPLEELRRTLLPYWTSLLRPGGRLTAVVPDAEAMISEFSAGRLSFEELRLVTFGQQEYDKDFHFNMFSRASIQDLLQQAGLQDVRVVASGRRNGICYEMEVEGRRPDGTATAASGADATSAGG
ncbi:MAG: hypothetical protein E6J41_21190 [Chloroflexi bacterium]|nr:MAG: hypothetical protein E6J41_21190 [Chloroflexota bacterium]